MNNAIIAIHKALEARHKAGIVRMTEREWTSLQTWAAKHELNGFQEAYEAGYALQKILPEGTLYYCGECRSWVNAEEHEEEC